MTTKSATAVRGDALGGGRLVGAAAFVLLAMSALILVQAGTGEAGLRIWIRATARTSLAIFGAVYAASSLRRLWPAPFTGWLLRERRYLGLSFAISHGLHLLAILSLALVLGDAFEIDTVTIVFGGGAYVMLALMALTSNDASVARLGRKRWKLLHRIGIHWIWVVFAFSYTGRAAAAVASGGESPWYLLPAVIVWAVAGLRFTAWRRTRRGAGGGALGSLAS